MVNIIKKREIPSTPSKISWNDQKNTSQNWKLELLLSNKTHIKIDKKKTSIEIKKAIKRIKKICSFLIKKIKNAENKGKKIKIDNNILF